MYMVFLSSIMGQNRPEFSKQLVDERTPRQSKEKLASCEGSSAIPFADQGAHCRPWTQASHFSCSKYKRACEVVDKAVMGDAKLRRI
jgi:hypothetical protein